MWMRGLSTGFRENVSPLCHEEKMIKTTNGAKSPVVIGWEYTGSNRGPSACKADALNQLSYTPILKRDCKHSISGLISKIILF